MKDKSTERTVLSQRYESALRKHLGQTTSSAPLARRSLEAAQRLGRQAAAIGLETLDIARIHDQALSTLAGRTPGDQTERRPSARGATAFFNETVKPIEETHLTAQRANARLTEVIDRLGRRTVELAASNRRLKQKIVKRKTAEETLRRSEEHQRKVLKQSLRLQERLRRLTHQLMVAQENERNKIGRGLRDEIAQTLLGINVRMLSLKSLAMAGTTSIRKEIAATRKLVARSARIMHEVAASIRHNHEGAGGSRAKTGS